METVSQKSSQILIYTEQTPNPESLKFVCNRMLFQGLADFKDQEQANEWSPLASELFGHESVKAVYISNNFVTITKKPDYDWHEQMIPLKEFIKQYIESGKAIINEGYEQYIESQQTDGLTESYSEQDLEIVKKIKEIIEHYVKPAVEMDGGNIVFKSYNDGVVTVMMQGSCSGCPSSTVTLKSGIEGLMKRMLPSVKEVVAEAM
ncbi:MAG: NifU family protein [Saprospiraceae bacterium]|nr:NifU family protein [Saprospiraceae bacterium]